MFRKPTPYEIALWAALPMAHTPRLEGRLTLILDQTRSRRATTRRALLLALTPGAAALVALAVLRLDARAQAAPPGPMLRQTAAPVMLAGIADLARPEGPWWDANGAVLPKPVLDMTAYSGAMRGRGIMRQPGVARPGQQGRVFTFEIPAHISDPVPAIRCSTRDRTRGGLIMSSSVGTMRMIDIMFNIGAPDDSEAFEGYAAAFPASLAKTDLQVAVASGPWREVVDCPKTVGKVSVTRPSGAVVFTLIPNPQGLPAAQAARGDAVFMVSDHFRSASALRTDNPLQAALHDGQNYQRAVYALDRAGRVVSVLRILPQTWPDPADTGDYRLMKTQQLMHLPNSLLKRVASFRLVARPFQWTTFKDVALQPAP